MTNVHGSSYLCEVPKDNCLGEEPSYELWVAVTLQMNILSQEDITTATTAAKTMKYRCSEAQNSESMRIIYKQT